MPGSVSPPKVMPMSTMSHSRSSGGPVAVEIEVHADLAHAAKRDEHELGLCRSERRDML